MQNPICNITPKREVHLESIACGYCNHEEECGDHILVKCSFARIVLEWISMWCRIDVTHFNTMLKVLDFAKGWGNCPMKRRILLVICYGTLGVFGGQEMIDYLTTIESHPPRCRTW